MQQAMLLAPVLEVLAQPSVGVRSSLPTPATWPRGTPSVLKYIIIPSYIGGFPKSVNSLMHAVERGSHTLGISTSICVCSGDLAPASHF